MSRRFSEPPSLSLYPSVSPLSNKAFFKWTKPAMLTPPFNKQKLIIPILETRYPLQYSFTDLHPLFNKVHYFNHSKVASFSSWTCVALAPFFLRFMLDARKV